MTTQQMQFSMVIAGYETINEENVMNESDALGEIWPL